MANNADESRNLAYLLASVEREAHVSQRKLASELGVALGLVNVYIKRCVNKGLIKAQQAPSRRYAYYLTPRGFAEKSRLTAEYLSWSFTFFRSARTDCTAVLDEARARGWRRVGFIGGGDLAEIAILSAWERGVTVVGLVDARAMQGEVMGVPTVEAAGAVEPEPDGWIITAITDSQLLYEGIVSTEGAGRVLAPRLLSVRPADGRVMS